MKYHNISKILNFSAEHYTAKKTNQCSMDAVSYNTKSIILFMVNIKIHLYYIRERKPSHF